MFVLILWDVPYSFDYYSFKYATNATSLVTKCDAYGTAHKLFSSHGATRFEAVITIRHRRKFSAMHEAGAVAEQ